MASRLTNKVKTLQHLYQRALKGLPADVAEPEGPFSEEDEQEWYDLLRTVSNPSGYVQPTFYQATLQSYTTTSADCEAKCGAGKTGISVTRTSSGGSSTISQQLANAQAFAVAKAAAIAAIVCPVVPTTPVNQKPVVSFNRKDASTPTVGVALQFVAVATDSDGSIKKAQLYRMANATTTNVADGELLDTDLTSPYMLSWTPTAAGNFPLRVLATDNSDATQFSTVLQVSVVAANAQVASITSTPAPAMVGDVVTIPGSNFGAASLLTGKVMFGTVPVVNFIRWSPAEIIAIVPEGAQSGKITVLTADGRMAVSPADFTVAVPAPLGLQQASFDFLSDKSITTNLAGIAGATAFTALCRTKFATAPGAGQLRNLMLCYTMFNLAIYDGNYYFSLFTSDGEFHVYTPPTGDYALENLAGKTCLYFGTYDGAMARAYIALPGQAPGLIGEVPATGTINGGDGKLYLGSWGSRYPNATMEQAQLWTKALSAAEVEAYSTKAILEPESNQELCSYIVAEAVDLVTDPSKPHFEKSRFKQQLNYSDPSPGAFVIGQTTLSLDPPALVAGPAVIINGRVMSVDNSARVAKYRTHGGLVKTYTGPITLNEQAQIAGKYEFWYEATPTSLRSSYSYNQRVEAATAHSGFPLLYLDLKGRTITSLDATKTDFALTIANGNGSNLDVSKFANLTGKVARGGHSTFGLSKARMNLTFDAKQSLVPGGYNDTDWVLMADARDPSFTNTTSALFLNNRSGLKGAKYLRVEVIDSATGISQGTWVLVEKTKWAIVSTEKALATDASIPMMFEKTTLSEEDPADITRPNGTPGWVETPLYANGAGLVSQFPKVKDLTDAFYAQQQNYVVARENSISQGYAALSQYIHVRSSHATYMVQEFFRNYDFGHKSDLYYKLKNSNLSYNGPGKDFDVAGAFRANQAFLGGAHTPFVKNTPEYALLWAVPQYRSECETYVLNEGIPNAEATYDNMLEETRLLQCYGIPDRDDLINNARADVDNQFTIAGPYVQYAQHYGAQRLTSCDWYREQLQAMPILVAA